MTQGMNETTSGEWVWGKGKWTLFTNSRQRNYTEAAVVEDALSVEQERMILETLHMYTELEQQITG